MPTFRNTLSVPAYEDGTDIFPKRRYIKLRRRGITQKKTYYNHTGLLTACEQDQDGYGLVLLLE
jgi:hypothetical protein